MLTEGTDRVSSGIPDLDELLDGLMLGDNVVWVVESTDTVALLEDNLLREAVRRKQPCTYVTATGEAAKLRRRLPPEVKILDARPGKPNADPTTLETTIVEGSRGPVPACVVFDDLGTFATRWRADRAVAFFSRVCPRLFDLGALAYWRAPRKELSRSALDRITQVTQCVLELGTDHLRVVKSEGREARVQGSLLRVTVGHGTMSLESQLGLGRLGRGLERIRHERNLTQTDLARMGKVTPSAISQAEAGRRGLSLDTLLLLSERLGVTLDELLSGATAPDYVLARRPRGFSGSKRALHNDPRTGLRSYLVRLGPGESGTAEEVHKDAELVLVASGLVQVTVGADTPVMRAGDAVLATKAPVSGWRNLTGDTAMLFVVLRD
ncbi:MAG: helix-turn-helix domain-containing protein [Acidimicrobiia bacterium]